MINSKKKIKEYLQADGRLGTSSLKDWILHNEKMVYLALYRCSQTCGILYEYGQKKIFVISVLVVFI